MIIFNLINYIIIIITIIIFINSYLTDNNYLNNI